MAKRGKVKIGGDRYNDSYNTKDRGGATGKQYFKTPSGIEAYEPKEGINKINIIPYQISTKNHPRVKAGKSTIGDYDYNLDIWVHRNVGGGSDAAICPKRTYGGRCPICDESYRLKDDGKDDEAKALMPSRRVIYCVEPIVKGESQGLKVWNTSHYLFEKELIEEAHACVDGNDIIQFADPDEGKVIKFRGSEEKFGSNKYLSFKNFAFLDREEELDQELLDKAPSLDAGLVVLSYEELEKMLFAVPEEEDDDDDSAKKKKSSKRKDEEEEDEDEDEDEPVKKKKSSKEDEEDEDEDSAKKKKPSKHKDEEEEDDDEPVKDKKASKEEKGKCPHGYTFGKDCDEHKECQKCKLWDKCMEAGA